MGEELPSAAIWRPTSPQDSQLYKFKSLVESHHEVSFESYNDIYDWSIHYPAAFWALVWEFVGIRASKHYSEVVDETLPMFPRPTFFKGARLNFAEQLLFPSPTVEEDSTAVFSVAEDDRYSISWKELRRLVSTYARALLKEKLEVGDRVAGYIGNHLYALVAMLATTSIGCIWTAISPDTGAQAVLDRLQQITPKVIFIDNATRYNGKIHNTLEKGISIVKGLSALKTVVIIDNVSTEAKDLTLSESANVYSQEGFERLGTQDENDSFQFYQADPDHPVYVLYSSGTTGKPKCIVHGAIGTLIQHKKEHILQCDMRPGDRLFYYTTCTWMMWHWSVSCLASAVTLVLYDGSPFAGPRKELAMFCLVDELQITHFGTSAKYLSILEQKRIMPRQHCTLTSLRSIYSTASPLAPSTFEYVRDSIGPRIQLASITGGTDIISLFGAPSPINPVFAGQIQVRGLGMAVQAWDQNGNDISNSGNPGELVCIKVFPCQPVSFWGSQGQKLYEKSYFQRFPGVWHHGDFLRINPNTGGLVMLGRSDGVLKPAGVRFGSSEIYNVLLESFPDYIDDALCVGRRRPEDQDEDVILFVKMADGRFLSSSLTDEVKFHIRTALSPRHVPSIVAQCNEIPMTVNGKKVEVAVKQIVSGLDIPISASVANVECLEWYRKWAQEN